MKPRLIKIFGIWRCATHPQKVGLGFTPKQAFDDWMQHRSAEARAEARRLKKEKTQ